MSFSFYLKYKIETILVVLQNYLKTDFRNDLKSVSKKALKHKITITLVLLLGFVIAVYFSNKFFEVYTVEGNSMYPNFKHGDIVLLENLSGTLAEWLPTIRRGDVIVFVDVRNAEKKDIPPRLLKRVMGLPGESIYATEDETLIKDKKGGVYKVDNKYNLVVQNVKDMGPATVLGPQDYYVLGDNKKNSRDSRSFGTVQPTEMLGRVIYEF